MTRILHNYSNVEDWDPAYITIHFNVLLAPCFLYHASVNHINWRICQYILLRSWNPASCLNRGPAALRMQRLHPSFDALQSCLEKLPHGHIPFWETQNRYAMNSSSNSIQVQRLSMLHINVLLPLHICMVN